MSALQVGLRRADANASTSHRKHRLETESGGERSGANAD